MSSLIQVYDPVAPCLTASQGARRSLDRLDGKVIGVIDNSKPNFQYLAEDLARELTTRYGVKAVVTRRKRSASQGLADNILDDLVAQTDAVITGSGD